MLAAGVALLAAVVGCEPKPAAEPSSAGQARRTRNARQSTDLLRSAIAQLQELPESVAVDLEPPSVELDSRSSTDGQDVFARVEYTPDDPQGGLNRLVVTTENAGFRRRQVQPGDIVRCYMIPDRESRNRLMEAGEMVGAMLNYEPIELKVAQVLGPNTLRLEKGLRVPTGVAKDLAARISEETAKQLEESFGVPDAKNFVTNEILALEVRGLADADGVPLQPLAIASLPGVAFPFRVEVWRVRDDQMRAIDYQLKSYAGAGRPAIGWEPTTDQLTLDQIMQRVNQWTRGRRQPPDWAPAKLLATLDEKLTDPPELAEYASRDAMARKTFADYEGRLIQEAVWLRDVSRWAAGDRFDPLLRTGRLFDWVVRNITLSSSPRVAAHRPWQALAAGRGGAVQRAWVFAGLCRQQKIPACVVEAPRAEGEPWLWCGVLVEGKLRLFDPQLGLPLPGSDGASVATLAELRADPALLRGLDLPDTPYPVAAEQLDKLTLNVVAGPMALSWRAAEFQTQLKGEEGLVLSVDADEQAAKFATLGAGEARLWPAPFEHYRRRLGLGPKTRNAIVIDFRPFAWRPALWQARTLHFRGRFETEAQAAEKAKRRGDALYEAANDHRKAAARYRSRSVRPSESRLAAVTGDKQRIYRRAKIDATYWLGLLQYEQGRHERARLNYFEHKVLASEAAERLADGVRYNRARCFEEEGDLAAAAELLEADTSAQRHGNRLRAERLRRRLAPAGGAGPPATDRDPQTEAGDTDQATPPPTAAASPGAEAS